MLCRSRGTAASLRPAWRRFSSAAGSGRSALAAAPTLRDFMQQDAAPAAALDPEPLPPYLSADALRGDGRRVHVETYGCQMNVSDSEVVASLLADAGFERAVGVDDADVVLLNTCAIREKAESRVFDRLREIRALKRDQAAAARRAGAPPNIVGLLGCMGERLKGRLLERERLVDIVCGPDAYRSLPRLIASQ